MDGPLPSLGGSPANPRMVPHQPKDGYPPEEYILQTRNLALRLNSQNRWKMIEFDTEELILVEGLIFLKIMINHNVDPTSHQVNAI